MGTDFSLPVIKGKIIGFYGRRGIYLDSIGVVLAPEEETRLAEASVFGLMNSVNNNNNNKRGRGTSVVSSTSKRKSITVGPWGGKGGGPWTFKPDGRITQLNIRCGYIVDAIYFNYMDGSGETRQTDRFGGRKGGLHQNNENLSALCTQVHFGKDEVITNISGSVGTFEGCTVITSLIFVTNTNTYGPYGTCKGTDHFSVPVTKGKIIGFYGRHGIYLDSIGVVLAPST
ncbi:horcolin-like [Bidens hawaiensis]|uniref:horcolin-like n=1 Tax=Bidens hawaiensis TaxID=980011 RepID=UPI00404ADD1D